MNSKLLLLIIILYGCRVESQNYIDYFHKINTAESLIGSLSYREAFAIYDGLRKTYSNHFYKDIHNACLCALKLEKYKEASALACDLVKHGYELKDFESSAFDSFRNNEKYWKKFLSKYPEIRKKYEKKMNLSLREKYYNLYIIDQQATLTHGDIRTQDSIFYELAVSLSTLIKKEGFPNWFQNKDTTHSQLYILLRHYCGLKNRINNSEEMQQDSLYIRMTKNDIPILIEQALHKGHITPDMYENASTYWDNSNPYGKLAVMIDYNIEKVYPFLFADSSKISQINHRRELIGLPLITGSLGELSDTLLYSTWYKIYPFNEIREAILACDTCKDVHDYYNLIHKLNFEVNTQKKYLKEKQKDDFILRDWLEIRDKHYMGLSRYIKKI